MNLFLRFLTEKTSQKTDVYYIDSTFLEVCKNQRIYRHKTFKGLAQRGVSSCVWFYGFKLHLITNHLEEIVSFAITKGNISDQNMKPKPISEANKFLLKKRGIIETVFGRLKDFRHLVHTK